MTGCPGEARGCEAFVLGEHTLILDFFTVVVNEVAFFVAVLHGGDQGTHFEGGTGRVFRAEGPVEEGLQRVCHDVVPVLVHGGKVEGGIAGTGENFAGLRLHDHHRSAFGIQTSPIVSCFALLRVGDVVHDLLQRLFRHFLNFDVNGGLHRVSGDGVFGIVGLGGSAVLVDFVIAGAVNAVEVFLKGQLEAGLAHLGVHGVPLLLIFSPLLVVHAAQIAKDVGGVLGVVFPDGGGLDVEAGGVQLQNGGQLLVGNVLQEGIGRKVCDAAQVKFVPEADNGPGILVRPFVRNGITGAHLLHQQGGSDVGIQATVHHEQLEVVLPGGVEFGKGVGKGAGCGHGEVVGVGDAQLPALLHQIKECLVAVGVGFDDVVVEHQVVGSPVAHQNVTVAVQNIAPGRADGGNGAVDLGIIGVALGVDDLQLEKPQREQKQNKGEQAQKHTRANAAYSFHVLPPIRPVLQTREYSGIIMRLV